MTYCLALRVDAGIVFASDTRTNAGVDYVTSYRKLHVFDTTPDRLFVIQSAGNLATTHEVLDRLRRDLLATDGRESLATANHPFEAADYVGRVSQAVQLDHVDALARSGVNGEATLLLGGQIKGGPHRLFLIYPQGNYIEASEDTPYLQVGESKYGKPMLDRIGSSKLSLEQAARLAIVSLDATVRSNITVGLPYDLAIYAADQFQLARSFRIEPDSAFYENLRATWQRGLQQTFDALPRFDWEQGAPG